MTLVNQVRAWGWSFVLFSCTPSRFLVRDIPKEPFDVLFVPGCRSEPDGSLSRCQMGRAGWAAWLWKQGTAKYIVTSGGAVGSPFYEADALAEALVVLGVPAEVIYLDRFALHTDENMWNSLRIARHFGWEKVAVATNRGQAEWACKMLEDWGQEAVAYAMDIPRLEQIMPPYDAALKALRSPAVTPWADMATQETAREQRTGRSRPPSYMLYPAMGSLKWSATAWIPIGAENPEFITWAEALAQRK